MAVVGYLIGAGASAQCIPVVNGMKDDLLEIRNKVFNHFSQPNRSGGNVIPENKSDIKQLLTTLETLSEICDKHYSIDTYAKKLYLTDKGKFGRLKLDLCLYFTLKQIWKDPDKRYDNFFSSIITTADKLPSNIKIISWNYDFQIEKSFLEFYASLTIDNARDRLGLKTAKNWIDQKDFANQFNVIKLNGSAIIESDEQSGFLFESLKTDSEQLIEEVVENYLLITRSRKSFECELKFAWENENYKTLFDSAGQDLQGVEVLVVIGYSFPFFNREVDMKLFQAMPNLEKIYIQDKNPELIRETMEEFVRIKIGSSQVIDVVLKRNLEQYVFPRELDIIN